MGGTKRGEGVTAGRLHVTGVTAFFMDSPPHVTDGPVVLDRAKDLMDTPAFLADTPPRHEVN
jgi:hypothetical protein